MSEAGIIEDSPAPPDIAAIGQLPRRPPLLCPGCPHVGTFFVLASMGQRLKPPGASEGPAKKSNLVITGDIGCYTLATYPPLNAMDTTACMGASIGQALGMQKAGLDTDVVAVIGDSTFMHSGITPLIDAVYNEGKITIVILDNGTTAMTGHQEHPGTGISAQGKEVTKVQLENVVRGVGVSDVAVVDAYDIKELRTTIRKAVASPKLSVIIARGDCAVGKQGRGNPRVVDTDKCNRCDVCLLIGCPAIQTADDKIFIDSSLCAGEICTVCQQVCPQKAISPLRADEDGADNRPGESE